MPVLSPDSKLTDFVLSPLLCVLIDLKRITGYIVLVSSHHMPSLLQCSESKVKVSLQRTPVSFPQVQYISLFALVIFYYSGSMHSIRTTRRLCFCLLVFINGEVCWVSPVKRWILWPRVWVALSEVLGTSVFEHRIVKFGSLFCTMHSLLSSTSNRSTPVTPITWESRHMPWYIESVAQWSHQCLLGLVAPFVDSLCYPQFPRHRRYSYQPPPAQEGAEPQPQPQSI